MGKLSLFEHLLFKVAQLTRKKTRIEKMTLNQITAVIRNLTTTTQSGNQMKISKPSRRHFEARLTPVPYIGFTFSLVCCAVFVCWDWL